ncbi:MAG: hypothetical protein RLY78_3447 [Pseudomonadota bacterium]
MPADFDVPPGEDADAAHRTWTQLRARCPVAHTDALGGFWALTRHADVARVAADHTRYTTTVQNVVPKVAFTGRRPPLHLDPPDQTPYRAALNPLLSAERVARLAPAVRAIVAEAWAPLIARGGGDLCGEFSARFPVRVFGHWMNLDGALEAQLMQSGPAFIQAVQAFDTDAMRGTSLVLYDMARTLVAARRADPRPADEDPVSALLATRVDGQPLPDEMVVGTVRQVLVVGIVAPMVMVGSIGRHLAQHPELHDQLRAQPALRPAAVEEFLRLYTPYRGFARTPRSDVELGGRPIRAGEPLALTYASANRDEAVFDDPHTFRLDRPNIGEHLAFGRGAHYCAGAHLARLELAVALDTLVDGCARITLDGEARWCPYPEIGPYALPVRLQADAARGTGMETTAA